MKKLNLLVWVLLVICLLVFPRSGYSLEVTNLINHYSSDDLVVGDNLQLGDLAYEDRNHIYTQIPTKYLGLKYIKTINDDKCSTGSPVVSFGIDEEAFVYLLHDTRAPAPSWLGSFTLTGDVIGVGDVSYQVFVKTLPAGSVVLGGNIDGACDKGISNYLVLLTNIESNQIGPQTPVPISPADGATVTTLTPSFEWSTFQDGGDGQTQSGYQFRILCDTDNMEVVYDTGFIDDLSGNIHTYSPGVYTGDDPISGDTRVSNLLESGKQYHWHVRYRDSGGNWSLWSVDWPGPYWDFFPVVDPVNPWPGPLTGIVGISAVWDAIAPPTTVDITFAWDASVGADGYRMFSREAGKSYNYDAPDWEGPSTTCVLLDLPINVDYYFVVRAYNEYGESGDSNEAFREGGS